MAEFEDDYPVLDTSSAQPADDYPVLDKSSAQLADDYPVLDSSTIHASNVPRPPEDDYPVLDQRPQTRGIVERTKEGFAGHYEPLLTDAVKKIAPSFAEQHPAITGVIQSALEKSPIGWADKAQAALFGAAPGAVAGAVAGAAEPLIGRSQADKLQSDTKTIIDMALIAPGLGWAGAATHGRGAQISDVGKTGLRQLNKQGQTAGADAAAGVAQEPRPPAAEPVADPQNKATLGDGTTEAGGENLNTRNYGKKTEPSAGGSGVNVVDNGVDPTLKQALTPEIKLDAAQREKFSGLSDEILQDFSTRTDKPELKGQIRQELELRKQQAAPPAEPAPVPAGTMELPPVEVRPAAAEPPPVREVRPEPAVPRVMAVEHSPMDMARRGELSADRANELAEHYANRDKQVVDVVLGDSAEAWRRAHKRSDQYWDSANDAKAKAQDKIIAGIEAKHPQHVIEEMYRKLEQGEHTDPQGWRDFSRDLRDVEGSRENAVTTVGYTLRRLPEPGKALGQIDRETLAVIQHALDREARRGGNPDTFLRDAFAKSSERYGGGPDAAEIIASDMARLKELMRNPPQERAVPSLPAPKPTVGTLLKDQRGGARLPPAVEAFLRDERGGVRAPDTTRLVEKARAAYNTLLTGGKDLINEIQMATSPMAARSASNRARAIAKDQANAIRAIDQAWTVIDNHIMRAKDPVTKKLLFDEASRKEMWERADQESVMRQRGETSQTMGINALKPHERALVESFQPKAEALWEQARDIGWVKSEGLPYWTPRLFEGIVKNVEGALALDAKGQNIQTTTSSMKHRKYLTAAESEAAAKEHFGDEAKIIRDIRTMPFALAKMEKALVNRVMIKEIEAVGRRIGKETVIESDSKPAPGWFTIPDNPAFYTYRPRYEKADTATYRGKVESHGVVKVPDDKIPLFDRNGLPVLDRVPIWLPGEFEGPLRSIMTQSPGRIEQGLMAAKGKTMGLIMNSPAIHNMVEWGRAFPTMPGKMFTLQTYFEGNAAKKGVPYTGTTRYVRDWSSGKMEAVPRNASPVMMEAIDHGLVPIGKRFFNQDITAVMEQPDLTPGRSITAKALALVPDLYSPKAGDAVKRGVDRAGDVWHNTLLWDRIGDLQMGLYVNAKKDLIAKGVDPKSAQYAAAHIANRYAGALPNEAMSRGARIIANFLMFSRTFTLGNLGVLKDMVTGLPRDVIAQLERDVGVLDPKAVNYAKSLARRKAMMAVGLDIGLMYIGNSVLQSAINVLKGDNTLGEEAQGYVRRAHEAMQRLKEDNPLLLLNPITAPITSAAKALKNKDPFELARTAITTPQKILGNIESLSSTYENEPGKRDRIMIGKTAEGRGIYVRNPIGKLGEEFVGYATDAGDMFKRKMGTIARPLLQYLANDKGFGEKIYDPGAEKLDGKGLETALAVAKQFFLAQTPEGQLSGLRDLATGQTGEKLGPVPVAALQAFGPVLGFSFSRGHPQGPAAGEYARMAAREKFEQQQSKPEITKLIRNGRIDEAIERMNELGYPSGLRKALLNPHMTPRKFRDMAKQGTPEEQERFQRALEKQ